MADEGLGTSFVGNMQNMAPDYLRYMQWLQSQGGAQPQAPNAYALPQQPAPPPAFSGAPNVSGRVDLNVRPVGISPEAEAKTPLFQRAQPAPLPTDGQPSLTNAPDTARSRLRSFILGNERNPIRQELADKVDTIADYTPLGNLMAVQEAKSPEDVALAMLPPVASKAGRTAARGIRVYHSSPHDFDRFDISKIGTGEGAQSYGHGLYFAENPAVSGQGGEYWNQFLHKFPKQDMRSAEWLKQHGFDRDAAAEALRAEIERSQRTIARRSPVEANVAAVEQAHVDNLQKRFDALRSGQPIGPRTYEVNINARPEQMLDWDKPLKQQPQIVNRFPELADAARAEANDRVMAATDKRRADQLWGMVKDPLQATGEFAYRRIGKPPYPTAAAVSDDVRASNMLREAGIPGIRYLDQGSRWNTNPINKDILQRNLDMAQQELAMAKQSSDAGWIARQQDKLTKAEAAMNTPQGTSNYVMFDDKLIDILRKYGLAGLTVGGAAGAVAGGGAPAEAAAQTVNPQEERYGN